MPESQNNVVHAPNRHLTELKDDVLFHFGLIKSAENFFTSFSDVKFVCIGGSGKRLGHYAEMFSQETGLPDPKNLSKSERFVLYKTGPVLWINHGMGVPSLSIMLCETFKLLHYAGSSDVKFIRLGTSGGVGVEPGTVVVSTGVLNPYFKEELVQVIFGTPVARPAVLDKDLIKDLSTTASDLQFPVVLGKTFCADDFYEGQMRLDGAFCEYTKEDKLAFLELLADRDVKNIEMESIGFAALTHRANFKSAIICVTLLNRSKSDQIVIDHNRYVEFELRPYKVVSAFIRANI